MGPVPRLLHVRFRQQGTEAQDARETPRSHRAARRGQAELRRSCCLHTEWSQGPRCPLCPAGLRHLALRVGRGLGGSRGQRGQSSPGAHTAPCLQELLHSWRTGPASGSLQSTSSVFSRLMPSAALEGKGSCSTSQRGLWNSEGSGHRSVSLGHFRVTWGSHTTWSSP